MPEPNAGSRTVGAPSRSASRLAVAVVLLAAALRIHGLEAESLWFDEGHSLLMARLPPGDAVASLAGDVHPPLYFLALGAWTRALGESDAALRLLSVVFGTAAVAALYLLGRRLGGPRVGLVAALLSAVSPFHVRYAQEIRPYALLLLLSAVSTTALLRLAERPGSAGRRIAYAACVAALLYTHAHAVFVLLAHAIWGLVLAARPREGDAPGFLRAALLAGGAGLLLYAPWIPTVLSQAERVSEGGWILPPSWKVFYRTLFAYGGGELGFAATALLAIAALALPRPATGARGARLAAALLFAVPLLGPVAVTAVGPSIFLPRTAIACTVGLFLLAGLGVDALAALPWAGRSASRRLGAGAVVAGLLVAGAVAVATRTWLVQVRKPHNSQVREALAIVDAHARPGDALWAGHEFERAIVAHYLRRTDLGTLVPGESPGPDVSRVWAVATIHTQRHFRQLEERGAWGFRPATVDLFHRLELRRFDRP